MAKCAVWLEDGNCQIKDINANNTPKHSILGSLGEKVHINNPVGLASPNIYEDVFKIQYALNRIPPIEGGTLPRLEMDGKCGSKTVKAIQNFQLKHFGWKGADGKVEPNKQTISKLNEIGILYGAHPSLPLDIEKDKWLLAAMLQHLPYAMECVRAAEGNIFMAMFLIEKPSDSAAASAFREKNLMLANRHFKVDQIKQPVPALRTLYEKYGRMKIVLSAPEKYFGLDTNNSGEGISTIAVTRLRGYFRSNPPERIEFRRGSYFASQNRDFATHIMVHEMAHFVEQTQNHGHHAKGWVDDPAMKLLLPSQRLLNCDSMANFALEARNGLMERPGWLKTTVFR